MKKQLIFAGLALLAGTAYGSAEVSISANLFLGRAFSDNLAREMMMTPTVNQHSDSEWNGFFTATASYQRMWNQNFSHGIGAYPFWSRTNSMTVGNNNGTSNVDAYQFGLGDVTTVETISLNPIVYQDGADLMLYAGASRHEHGFFAKIKTAICAMSVNPQFSESNRVTAVNYPAGALYQIQTVSPAATANPATSMTQAFAGNTVNGQLTQQGDFRVMTNGLINGIQTTGAALSDLEMTMGYNWSLRDEEHNVSLGARVTGPTGSKPQGIFMLEPVTGRGGSWGVGAYAAANINLWHGNQDNALTFKFMADVIHLCTTDTIRSYDLTANGNGSKFLLVADYQNGIYQNNIQNLVNLSTLQSKSSFGAQADIVFALSYAKEGFTIDLGYNQWIRSNEKLSISGNFDPSRYAILGRQYISATTAPATYEFSNGCQPLATISLSQSSDGTTVVTDTTVTSQNSVVDATLAQNRISGVSAFNTGMTAQYRAATSKVFAKIGYTWKDSDCCPFINFMSECEWSNISNNALPQWGLTLMGGISL